MLSMRFQFLLVSAAYLLAPVSAQGWWGNGNGGNCPPWVSSDNCNNNGGNNNGGSTDPSQYGLSQEELSRSTQIVTIHAVLACLVWVGLIPLGGILLRLGINSPWIVRGHAVLQSLSFLIYVVAAGMGVWLIRTLSYGPYSLWSDPHPKIGMAILFFAFLQPFFGLIHHSIYKKRVQNTKAGLPTKPPGRTAIGYVHLWLGRSLIVLGIINGGLGIRLASYSPYESHSKTKIIAYGVAAGIMLLLYLVFVVLGEIRRSKASKTTTRQQTEAGRAIPLLGTRNMQQRAYVPPIYAAANMPPTYEASQEDVRKQAQTTARYS